MSGRRAGSSRRAPADAVARAQKRTCQTGPAGCDRARLGEGAEATNQQRLVVCQPEGGLRVVQRPAGTGVTVTARSRMGTRQTAARSGSGTSLLRSASMTSGTKSRLPSRKRETATFTATADQATSGSGCVRYAM